jgi:hypothetical protein
VSRATIDTRSLSEKALIAAGRSLRESMHWRDDEKCQLIAEVWARKVIVTFVRAVDKAGS